MTTTSRRNCSTADKPVLKDGAIYIGDNGRFVCVHCAGASAKYSGRDISGQKVERLSVADVAYMEDEFRLRSICEGGCTTLSRIAGADGWPAATVNLNIDAA